MSTQQNDNDGNIFEDRPTNTSKENDEARIASEDEQAASSSQNDETGSARRQVEKESQQPQEIQQPAVRPKSTQPQPERRRSSSSEHGQPLSSDQPAAAQRQVGERETSQPDAAEPSTSRPPSDSKTKSQVSNEKKKKKRNRKKYVVNQERRNALRDRSTLRPPDRYQPGSYLLDTSDSENDSGNVNVSTYKRDDIIEPKNYSEAMQSKQREEWLKAMKEELQSMQDLNVYTFSKLLAGAKSIGNRWVFKLKRSPLGEIDRFEARLVLKGFSQRKIIDYKELYAPVCRFEIIRGILCIALRGVTS